MDRMVVVVFDDQSKAYEGKEALTHLDAEGSVVLYGYAVVAKDANGKVRTGLTLSRWRSIDSRSRSGA